MVFACWLVLLELEYSSTNVSLLTREGSHRRHCTDHKIIMKEAQLRTLEKRNWWYGRRSVRAKRPNSHV